MKRFYQTSLYSIIFTLLFPDLFSTGRADRRTESSIILTVKHYARDDIR